MLDLKCQKSNAESAEYKNKIIKQYKIKKLYKSKITMIKVININIHAIKYQNHF